MFLRVSLQHFEPLAVSLEVGFVRKVNNDLLVQVRLNKSMNYGLEHNKRQWDAI